MYGTIHAHLVHMCWPLSWALHQMGHSFARFGASKEVGGYPQGKSKGCPQPRAKLAAKQTGLVAQAGAKAAVMQTEHVQQFKVCYSRTQKFFTVSLDPQ